MIGIIRVVLGGIALAAVGLPAFDYFDGSSANAQARRTIQRAIQKNIQLNVRRQLLKLRIDGSAGSVRAMDLSGDGRYLVTVSADGAPRLWDLEAGRQIRTYPPLTGPHYTVRFLADARRFVTADGAANVIAWRVDADAPVLGFTDHRVPVVSLATTPDGRQVVSGDQTGVIRMFAADTGALLATLEGHGGSIAALDTGTTGQFVLSASDDGTTRIWEARTGAVIRSFDLEGVAATVARFGRDEAEVLIGDARGQVFLWAVDGERPVRMYPGASSSITALDLSDDGGTLLAAEINRNMLVWPLGGGAPKVIPAHGGAVHAVSFDIDRERVISAGDDGLTRVWNLADRSSIATLISTDKGWAVVDRQGRFDGSDSALDSVQWASDTQVLPIANFSEDYYEPGLLQKKRLGLAPLISGGGAALEDGILPPPTTRIEVPAAISGDGMADIEVVVMAHDQGGGIADIRLYHNGKILPASRVIADTAEQASGVAGRRKVYRVRPVGGSNLFTATAVSDERIVGMASDAFVRIDAPPPRPKLHLVTIGINKYRDRRLALNYALPDANAIRDTMRTGGSGVFDSVVVHEIFDKNASSDAIRKVLAALRDTAPDDMVLIYMAGHGAAAGDEFYFVPYEFKLPLTRKRLADRAISATDLRELMAQIGALRVVLLLDTCKAGQAVTALQDYVDRRALRRLGSTVGLHIIAATAKQQFAVELDALGHGVFTYTVIQGMAGAADLGPTDGNLTVKEIIGFAERQVPELSKQHADHAQWPMTFSRGLDFTVGRATEG